MIKNTANLLNLQNLMKRDPQSYLEEFRQQQRHFQANLHIFHNALATSGTAGGAAAPGATGGASSGAGLAGGLSAQAGSSGSKSHQFHKDFGGLVTFLSHVSPCFASEAGQYPSQLLELLTTHHGALDPPLRKTVVSAAILLQNRGLLDRMTLLPILFRLFSIQDKPLRLLLFHHIISDIKRINLKRQPGYVRVNSQLQNYMYTMLSDKTSPLAAKKSLDVMIDLWRRKIWNDAKTVHAIQNACFSKDTRIKVTSLRFFLGMSFYADEEEEEEEEEKQTIRAKLSVTKTAQKGVVKTSKRKKKEREMKRAQKKMNREDTGRAGHSGVVDSCPAIFLLHDPQSFAERLFSMVRHSSEAFSVRMLVMNVISRLVGAHRLVLLNFYPFLQKYMQPHQKNVTHILTYLAQASHPLVPPDVLAPCVRTLANHFVNDRSSPEVTAVGLNAIREICARAPLVMDAELLWDLVGYKKDKHKGVMMASRSLIALFRDINPTLLMRKERGRHAGEFDETELEFGNLLPVRTDIVGAELLAQINTLEEDADGDESMEGEEGKTRRRKAIQDDDDDDGWNLDTTKKQRGGKGAASDSEDEDEDDEDMGTNVAEINKYLRAVKHPKAMAADAKSNTGKGGVAGKKSKGMAAEESEDEDEDEEEDEEGMEEMEIGSDEEEDGEEGSGDEEEEEGEDEEDEEEEEEEQPASKKRRTATGVATRSTRSSAAAAAAAADDEEAEDEDAADGEEEAMDTAADAAAAPAKPALPLGATKIFTPKDFEEIHAARLAFHSGGRRLGDKGKPKRKREDGSTLLNASGGGDDDGDEDGGIVRHHRRDLVGDVVAEDAIVGWKSRKRMSKEERLASIMEGRDGGINAKKKGGGTTNMDKARAKPFQLVKHSEAVHRKKQRSFSQQQATFSGHIKTMKGMGKKIKNKMKKRKSSKQMSK